jgi:Peptidase family M23
MLPFDASEKVVIQRAWTTFNPATGRFDLNHHAVDYVLGKRDQPDTWKKFDALAAAPGEACGALTKQGGCYDKAGENMGNRVLVKHKVEGVVYYTFYNHLDSIAKGIPLNDKNNTVHVDAGQKIGVVGASNSEGGLLHLHWELLDANLKPIDPYGIYGITDQYPDPRGKNGKHAKKSWFLTDPPIGFNAVVAPTPTPGASTPPASANPSQDPAVSPKPGTPEPGASATPSGTAGVPGTPAPSGSPGVTPPVTTSDSGLGVLPVAIGIGALVAVAVLIVLVFLSRRRRQIPTGDQNWRP